MATQRRIGAESSQTRTALLDAAQQLMLDDGYAAVTSRRVAAKAGLKPQLVHYYFRTMDDLFLALLRRGAEQNLARLQGVVESPDPLRALWEFASDPRGTALVQELAALANHRKVIRSEIAAYAERFRQTETDVIAKVLAEQGVDTDEYPPSAVHVLMTGIARIMALEARLGVTTGHAEARELVERQLARLGARPT